MDKLICPFCGGELHWQSDEMSEDMGIIGKNRLVTFYHCLDCGAEAEFIQGDEE